MTCPQCRADHNQVKDSRESACGLVQHRRRVCVECGYVGWTDERWRSTPQAPLVHRTRTWPTEIGEAAVRRVRPRQQLTAEAVREIRRLSAEGVTNVALGLRFGVTAKTAGRVKLRQQWQNVE